MAAVERQGEERGLGMSLAQEATVGSPDWFADMVNRVWSSGLRHLREATFANACLTAQQIQENRGVEPWSFLSEDWRLMRVTEAPTFYGQYANVGDLVLVRKKRPNNCPIDHVAVFSLRFGSEIILPQHYLVAL